MAFIKFMYTSSLGLGFIPAESLHVGDEISGVGETHTVDKILGAVIIDGPLPVNAADIVIKTTNSISVDGVSDGGSQLRITPVSDEIGGYSMSIEKAN